MNVKDCMTKNVEIAKPSMTIQEAAKKMKAKSDVLPLGPPPPSAGKVRDVAFWKRPELQKFILELFDEMFPKKELPKWVKYNEFVRDMAENVFISLTDALEGDQTDFVPLSFMFPLVSGNVDTGASAIQMYSDDLILEIPEDVIEAFKIASASPKKVAKAKPAKKAKTKKVQKK